MQGVLLLVPVTTLAQANISIPNPQPGTGSVEVYLTDGYLNNGPGLYMKNSDGTYTLIGGPNSNTVQSLINDFANVGNNLAVETKLYSNNLPANTFFNVGDKIEFEYTVSLAANANNKTLNLYIGGTKVFNGNALKALIQPVAGLFTLKGYAVLIAAGDLRVYVQGVASANDLSYTEIQNQLTNIVDVVTTDSIEVDLEAIGVANNDIVSQGGIITKLKAA